MEVRENRIDFRGQFVVEPGSGGFLPRNKGCPGCSRHRRQVTLGYGRRYSLQPIVIAFVQQQGLFKRAEVRGSLSTCPGWGEQF